MLRPYQKDCLDSIKYNFDLVKKQLVVMPTGTGKSHIFSELHTHLGLPKKVLVLAHREELLAQAKNHLIKANPHLKVGLEKAESYAETDCDIVVGSVQTLGRSDSNRIQRLNPADFSAVVIDEAHHAVTKSYDYVLSHFGISKVRKQTESDILLLGVTATPNRSDKVGLFNVFDEIVYEYSITDAIVDGWLVEPTGRVIRTEVNLDELGIREGDFSPEELEAAINIAARNDRVIKGYLEFGENRPAIIFCASIPHSRKIAELLCKNGVDAAAVWYDDPYRDLKLQQFREGRLKVLSNAFLLGEGVDIPNISCVIQARPTKSSSTFVQQIGRGLRLQEGTGNLHDAIAAQISPLKKDCLIIDVVDNTDKHSLITLASLLGLPSKLNLDGMSLTEALEKVKAVLEKNPKIDLSRLDSIKNLDIYVRDVDLLEEKFDPEVVRHSKLAWTKVGDSEWLLALPTKSTITVKENVLGEYAAFGTAKTHTFREVFTTLREALVYSEHWVGAMLGKWVLKPLKRDAHWRKQPASPEQKAYIKRLMQYKNTESIDKLSAGRASDLITSLKNKS